MTSQADMKQTDLRAMYKATRISRIRLDGCKLHRFDPASFRIALGAKARCLDCGGEMPVLEVAQYIRGYMAAGGDPNAILAGFWPDGVPHGSVHCPSCKGEGRIAWVDCHVCGTQGHVTTAQAIAYVESLP